MQSHSNWKVKERRMTTTTRTTKLLSAFLVLLFVLLTAALPVEAQQGRTARAGLMSFDAIGHDVGLGLDVEMPFVRMPVGRRNDPDGKPLALVNVNIGAVITSALIAGGGMFVSYIFRSMGLRGRADGGVHHHRGHLPPVHDSEEGHGDNHGGGGGHGGGSGSGSASGSDHRRRSLYEGEMEEAAGMENQLLKMLDALKVVYRNSTTGERVATTMPHLYAQLEDTFAEYNIDLQACLGKTVCAAVRRAQHNMRHDRATGLDKLLEGLSNWRWLDERLRRTALGDAIAAGKLEGGDKRMDALAAAAMRDDCEVKYAGCMWQAPHEQLLELWRTHVRFT